MLIVNLVLQVHPLSVTCPHCPKKCKSKSGLKRHITVKHKDKTEETETDEPENRDLLTVETYASIVGNAKVKLRDSKIYPKANTDEIWSYNCNTLQSSTPKFPEIQGLYIQLTKSGNAERFYAAFYASIVLHTSSHFVGLSRNSATLLCSKVATLQRKSRTSRMWTIDEIIW